MIRILLLSALGSIVVAQSNSTLSAVDTNSFEKSWNENDGNKAGIVIGLFYGCVAFFPAWFFINMFWMECVHGPLWESRITYSPWFAVFCECPFCCVVHPIMAICIILYNCTCCFYSLVKKTVQTAPGPAPAPSAPEYQIPTTGSPKLPEEDPCDYKIDIRTPHTLPTDGDPCSC